MYPKLGQLFFEKSKIKGESQIKFFCKRMSGYLPLSNENELSLKGFMAKEKVREKERYQKLRTHSLGFKSSFDIGIVSLF